MNSTGIALVTNMTYGVNLPNYVSNKFVTADGSAMIRATGATHIRWPGGNWANMILWDGDYSVCPSFSVYKNNGAPWTLGWQEAGDFALREGIEVVWQMNAAVGLVCGPEVAASVAAKFVAAAVAHGSPVNVIEVGNENYGS